MTDDMKPISPELVLVDPEFARLARASLPAPPDCLAARQPLASPPSDYSTPATLRRATEIERRRDGQLRRAVAAAGWVLVAGVVASPLLAFMPQRSAPRIIEAPSPARAVTQAGTGAEERAGVISWPKVPAAAFYNLILVHATERVDLWPTEPNARIEPVEPTGSATPLVVYHWFVYPAFRRPSGKVRYGVVTARGSITVRGSLRTRINRRNPLAAEGRRRPMTRIVATALKKKRECADESPMPVAFVSALAGALIYLVALSAIPKLRNWRAYRRSQVGK